MSPATKSKSKSKEKPSAKAAAKEQQKTPSKLSGSTNTGNGSPASAYNPVSGTFHSLDTAPATSSPPLHNNGRFRNIDETDEHSGCSNGTAAEYDSQSNNGSCSGESEDHKEKAVSTAPRQETIPGSDNEKREKIRQKNERKHQRQRERRAQELHERCSGYLMSRKLESLSQQLVAMGFSSERATLALMLNEGRVEESINWLFEAGDEETQKTGIGNGANMKIDISEEVGQIAALEKRYKCSKQEVERAVVACEGDLKRAEETLKTQKPETPPVTPQKPEESPNPKPTMRPQEKPAAAAVTITTQSQPTRIDINNPKVAATVLTTLPEPGIRNLQSAKTNQSKSLAERRRPSTGSSSSLSSYTMATPVQVAPSLTTKTTAQLSVSGNEGRNIQPGTVTMMQRPQSMNIKPQNPVTNSISATPITNGWYANTIAGGVENMNLNGKLMHNQSTGSFGTESLSSQQFYPHTQFSKSLGPETLMGSRQFYPQTQTQYTQQRAYMSSSVDPKMSNSSWNTMGSGGSSLSPSLTVPPSSLGLFSGWGSSTGSNLGHVDWNTRNMMSNCDYNSIDWTVESNSSSVSSSNGMLGNSSGVSLARIASTNGVRPAGLHDGGAPLEAATSSSSAPREWTSPFAGKDIFSGPRQFVTSPSP